MIRLLFALLLSALLTGCLPSAAPSGWDVPIGHPTIHL